MTEDRFEKFIKNAAADYNRAPEIVPREEMWSRIQGAQKPTAVPGGLAILRVERGAGLPGTSSVPGRQWWVLAAAAGIVLVAGIGIGRSTRSSAQEELSSGPSRKQARATVPAPVAMGTSTSRPSFSENSAPTQAASQGSYKEKPARVALLSNRNAVRSNAKRTSLDIESSRMNVTYQLASIQHLAEAESMLTTFRSDSADRSMDPVVAKWSRDLLSNTRLLLDSPAARDPLRRHLLEDLELVLTQIVQLSNTPNSNERDLVESTIREGHVMTRLRSAIPAGQPKGS